jgi:flagellar assembly protein FliH
MSAKQRTRIIRPSQHEASAWVPPDVGKHELGGNAPSAKPRPMMTAAQLEQMSAQAHKEGYDQGHKEGFEYGHREGLEEGRGEMLKRLQRLDQVLASLETPFTELDEQVESEVVTLVVAMVRQLVRREVKADPGQIVGVVREALSVLPVSARRIRVLLHPDDAELVREAYAMGDTDQKWQIVEDPVIARGGCRVYTENSQIDATLESRLNSLIAPLLGSERDTDPTPRTAKRREGDRSDAGIEP